MKILKLTLKKQWFDMILSGEKKEEYREKKTYWVNRLCSGFPSAYDAKDFDAVQFYNGAYFSDKLPNFLIEWEGMERRTGRPEWGAVEGTEYFVIKLGEIIQNNTANAEN